MADDPDEDPTPPRLYPRAQSPRPRLQTPTERETVSRAALKERQSAVPLWLPTETTDVMRERGASDEEILAARARRPTPERLSKIEREQLVLVGDVKEMRAEQKSQGVLIKDIHDEFKLRRELEQKDAADRKTHARARVTEIIKWALSGGGVVYVLHRLGVL